MQNQIVIDLVLVMKVFGESSEEMHRGIYVENSTV